MGDKLRRGFKAQAERLAAELRLQLGLTVHDQLDPFALARYLRVPVLSLPEMVAGDFSDTDVAALRDPTARFSAVTVHRESRLLIAYNDAHTPERTVNDVVHELSHIVHGHPPRPAIGFAGCREWDDRHEEEATWQAGALLVPRDGAFVRLRRGETIEEAAAHFGVTDDLFRWRANATGVVRVLGLLRAS